MTVFQGFILGLIQGITEFLPISSSGHLIIGQKLLGFTTPPVMFDILVHVATVISVIYYFRDRILNLTKKDLWFLAIGSVPAAAAGFLLEPKLEFMFDSIPLLIWGFIITGTMMLITPHIYSRNLSLTTSKSLLIGSFQAFAILPSVSRSGSTVLGALLTGIATKEAFSYSFLLSIPAILGAALLHVLKAESLQISSGDMVGFITAGFSALYAIKILDQLIKDKKLHYFGYYCLFLAVFLTLIWQ